MKKFDENEIKTALKTGVVVTNEVELKTEIAKKTPVVISTDSALYERLLQKFSKEKILDGTKTIGGLMVILGSSLSILTYGLFSFIGVPVAGIGALLGFAGSILDDFKKYNIFMDYENMQVAFIRHDAINSLKKLARKEQKDLAELFDTAEIMVEEYQDLLGLMKELSAESIAELIEKHTEKAFVNGVIHDYNIDSSFTEEEAKVLAEAYSQKIYNQCNYIIDEVKRLGGDVEEVKSILSAIPFYSNK